MKVLAALCAIAVATVPFSPGAQAAVKVRYFKGQPTYVSGKAASVIQVVMPEPSKDRRASIAVVALNRSGLSQTLGYENITLRTAAGEPVKTFSYDELKHKAKVRAGWATFFAAVAGGVNGYMAQQSANSRAEVKATTSTPYGRVSTSYSVRRYDPLAAQIGRDMAMIETYGMVSSVSASLNATLARLDDSILRTTTIDPNQSFGGMVVFDLPKNVTLKDLIATVRFAGEVHDISLAGVAGPLDQGAEVDIDAPAAASPTSSFTSSFAARAPADQWRSQEVAYATTVQPQAAPSRAITCRTYLIRVPSDPSQNVCAN
jgi:hypothetical protein